jgi:hypothetical protein
MLAVLNFSHRDRDLALNLLRWITELGGCKGHDLFLSCNRMAAEANMHADLAEEAAKSFDNVGLAVQGSEDERGWPVACNHAWREMVYFIHARVQKPWLWLEPDVTPLKPGWMDAISAEYDKAGKGFMGCDVNVAGSKRHVSGIAVYPPNVMAACKRRYLNGLNANDDPKLCEAWDMYFAAEFMAHAHFTPLIQHIQHWPNYPDAPTFKDSGPEIHPEAVLFHRVKDGSLIERMRKQRNGFDMALSDAKAAHEISVAVEAVPDIPSFSEIERLKAELAELRELLKKAPTAYLKSHPTPKTINRRIESALDRIAPRMAKRIKQKPKRTPEEQTKINARMEKARAGRKVKA